jgi:sulfate adenylyltransferase subunit 2
LRQLESEAIYILREVAALFERPVLLFSGGKDSVILVHLAWKAFWPLPFPFPLVHVDTGHNFPETIEFRDWLVERVGCELIVGSVQASIDKGRVADERGPYATRNHLQTVTLLDLLAELHVDAAIGGARRSEEKARAKERIFSHRDAHGQWNPRNQRPELWTLVNARKGVGEHFRVFPIANWTELDVWQYIAVEGTALPSLYFAHVRSVFRRGDLLMAQTPFVTLVPGERAEQRRVRFRTVGDATCTGAIESDAEEVGAILRELATSRVTERGCRVDDRRSDAAMEDRKREGYF